MDLESRHIVVTGGGSGIGRAMIERFAQDNPRGLVVVDRNAAAARAVAASVDGLAVTADVSVESDVLRVIKEAESAYGPIDVFCSNAGISQPVGALGVTDEEWQRYWNVHVMAHVWAARALVPAMVERGEGYLLSTASAGGLLMVPGAAPYTVTKHASLALAESLAVLYQGSGVRFSCLCPGLVDTPLLSGDDDPVGRAVRANGTPMQPAEVAELVVEGLREERFLIMTHPQVQEVAQLRASEPQSYIEAMRGLWVSVGGAAA
jgi:NAD(P)-dependent dehydrogenase (short-subunit alcohol dehydrogenase family)